MAAAAKLSVSSQAFAALLECCGTAAGDCDGLLLGRAARPPAPPPSFSDDDDSAATSSSAPTLSISITGHTSLARPSSLSDALGRFQPYSPARPATVGFFSSRRSATRRPSMREVAVARSLSKSLALTHPLVFLLVAPSASSNHSIHSFDYRAFLLVDSRLYPTSLQVVNVGPGFRGQYHTFAAESPMPWLPHPPAKSYSIGDQKAMDGMMDAFGLGRVEALVASATGQSTEVEEMYSGMLRRLERLAREAEGSKKLVRRQVLLC
ncbi:hypothetical protein D1007_12832 [Hordeum vulgare]|nr:hypothetical protein D1007_12832 [Hordeum vulgare]